MTSGDDDVFREIVEHYGDRPDFPPPASSVEEAPAGPDGDHYVPPVPPAAPLPPGARGLAWLGVLGVPLLTFVLMVLPWQVPGWLLLVLLAWFAGGFVYLVATMNRSSHDGWDDGAVV